MSTEYVYSNRFTDGLTASQENIIDTLERAVKVLENRIRIIEADIAKITPKATFYLNLERRLIPPSQPPDLEVVQAWQTFIMMIKLTLEQPVAGLTKA